LSSVFVGHGSTVAEALRVPCKVSRFFLENLCGQMGTVEALGDIVRPEPLSAAFTAASTAAMRSVVSRSNYSSEMEDGRIARVR
jgi:hypothetical protein